MGIIVLALVTVLGGKAQSPPPMQLAAICFNSGEQESGMNKICYYDCLSGTVAITIDALKFCPLSIDHD